MPARKIQNENEVKRWFEAGWTYREMVDYYDRHYNIETTIPMFANLVRRRGWEQRIRRNVELLPWKVEDQHSRDYAARMLRAEGRRRLGKPVNEADSNRLVGFKARLAKDDLVVHYDPDTEEGFWYVPRREGIDLDLIREPDKVVAERELEGANS